MSDVHEMFSCPGCGAQIYRTNGVPDECIGCLYASLACTKCGLRNVVVMATRKVENGLCEYEDVKSWFCLDCGAGGVATFTAVNCPNCGARIFETNGVPDKCSSCLYAHRECSECGSRRTVTDTVASVEFGMRENWYEDVISWHCLDCGAGGVEGG